MTPLAEMSAVIAMIGALSATTPAAETINRQELYCLAENVYFEARGEPIMGQVAVAHVTLNRVASPDYPDTICAVVHEPAQFSWTLRHRLPAKQLRPWKIAVEVAAFSMVGFIDDRTGNATHYYAPHLASPTWAGRYEEVALIGNHRFMKGER